MLKPLSLQTANMSFGLNSNITKSPSLSKCPNNLTINSRFRLGGKQICAVSEKELPAGLQVEAMPKHVALIMDGNRRWAKSKGLSPLDGHMAGGKALKQLFHNCVKYGVKVLTVFAFSTQNWVRPKEEVEFLMDLFSEIMVTETEMLVRDDVRLSFMGRMEQLPELLQKRMSVVEETTKDCKGMHLVMACNYSGRYDVTEATKKIATKVKHGVFQVEDIDDAVIEQHLGTNMIDEFPSPDLMIRSSGESRLSNFMLWQCAYTEMFFTKKLFPDFDDSDFMEAIAAFQGRQRRFGGQKY